MKDFIIEKKYIDKALRICTIDSSNYRGLTKHHATKTYWGSGGIAPRILDPGPRWS